MRAISALDVRARFGQVLDEAAAGERFVVERAGQAVAAIVPLRDLDAIDPERIRERRLAAIDQLVGLRARTVRPVASTGERPAPVRPAGARSPRLPAARRPSPAPVSGAGGRPWAAPVSVADAVPPDAAAPAGAASAQRSSAPMAAEAEPARADRPPDGPTVADGGATADTGWRQW